MAEGVNPPESLPGSEEGKAIWEVVLEWEGWTQWSPWIWIAGLFLGYLLLLRQQPMRDVFGEGWALLLDKGNGWVLGSVATVSMLVTTGNWWSGTRFTAGCGWWTALEEVTFLQMLMEAVLDFMSGVLGACLPSPFSFLSAAGLPPWSNLLLGVLWVLLGFLGTQLTILFFHVRSAMPGRKLVFWSFLEVAFQRLLSLLPLAVLVAFGMSALAVFASSWWVAGSVSGVILAVLALFCFAHPAAAASSGRKKAVPLLRALRGWRERPFAAIWFLFMLALHGVLLGLLRGASFKMMEASPAGSIAAAYGLSFLRALLVVWFAATWAVFNTRAFPPKKR
ncbi:MAG: hypothetical protein AAGJ79_14345 [Verrucomicrobiota bacterium]